ncbi:MAG: DUF1905 domain-containing protein [Ilumatobacteraceae bacterium]
MEVEFSGELWFWRGPAPWYFITVPDAECQILKDEWTFASYGWGMIPVTARVRDTSWTTSLFPKDARYVLPVKAAVRDAEQLDEGDSPLVHMTIRLS